MPPRVLVTGATGVLGPAVVESFVAAGWQVRTLSRHPAPAGVLPAGVEHICGDITEHRTVETAVRDTSLVIHMAALLHDMQGSARVVEYQRVNVEGTRRVVQAACDAAVDRVVLASSISVYGSNRPGCLTESAAPSPGTPYARTKFEAERVVLDARRRDGVPLGSVLRLAAVYGPRIQGNYLRLLRALAARRFVWIGRGQNRRALIYATDAAHAFVLAGTHPRAAGRLFNVSDGECPTMNDVVNAMSAALGQRAPSLRVPAACARAVAGVAEAAGRLLGIDPPIRTATVDKLLEDVAIDSSVIRRELAFSPSVTLADGWHAVAQCLRAQGELS